MKDKLLQTTTYLKNKGVEYADCRFVKTRTESLTVAHTGIEGMSRNLDVGVGIRVLADGAWGFASIADLSEASLKRTANQALSIAHASAITTKKRVRLAEQDIAQAHYQTPFKKDPFDIPIDDKINLLARACEILQAGKQINTTQGHMTFLKINKLFVSTEGAVIEQDLMESGAGIEVVASNGSESQRRSYPNSFGGDFATRGYEFVEQMNLPDHAERIREESIQLLSCETCPDEKTTIILGGPQLALQVHESCGHPTELDRALGTEISLAGGSFMTPDKLRKLKYGSDIVNIYADATNSGGLGSFGYDDEGVKARRIPLIKNGLFVGYLSSRETAPVVGRKSSGAMRASSWNRLPLIRMVNVNLEPGSWELDDLIADTKKGVFFDLNKSWSIDDRRLNFQFGSECAWEIKNGKLGRMYKNPVYTGITPEFWNNCDAICNKNHWHLWGLPNCGKGEPMQSAHVAHGTAPARFRNVRVGVIK